MRNSRSNRPAFLVMTLGLALFFMPPAWSAREWESFNRAGLKALDCDNFDEAEKLYKAALKIAEQPANVSKPYLADTLVKLGFISLYRQDFAKAESFYKKALALREKQLGPKNTKVAEVLEYVGYLANWVHKADSAPFYARAEKIWKGAIAADQKKYGPTSLPVAADLRGLASQYNSYARSADAGPLYRRALAIREKLLGPADPSLVEDLQGLATSLLLQTRYFGKDYYAEAEVLYKRALAIDEKKYGPSHVKVLNDLHNLAKIYQETANYSDALKIYQRFLASDEKKYGAASLEVAEDLDELGTIHELNGDGSKADSYFLRADAIREKFPRSENEDYLVNGRAGEFERQKKWAMAVAYYKRALLIQKRVKGAESQDAYTTVSQLNSFLQKLGRFSEAEPFALALLALDKKAAVPNRYHVETDLKNLAYICWRQYRFSEAESYYLKALALSKSLSDKIDVQLTGELNSLALLYRDLDRFAEAELLLNRSLELDEKGMQPSHNPAGDVGIAQTLSDLGSVYRAEKKYKDAESAYIRAIALHKASYGIEHPDTAHDLNGLAIVYLDQGRYSEAKTLFEQARKQTVITDYLPYKEVVGDLNGLASFYEYEGNIKEAEKLYKRAIDVASLEITPDHKATVAVLTKYAALLKQSNRLQAADELTKKAKHIQALYSAYSAVPRLKKTSDLPEQPDFTVVHPLLNIPACQALGAVELDPAIYKKLIAFTIPGKSDKIISRSWNLDDQWNNYFGKAESEAAVRLGKLANGMTKAQLTDLLGPPGLKMGRIDCWNTATVSADNWLYKIGGSKILLCLSFVDDRCSNFKVCSLSESYAFDEWRVKKLCASAIGKTVAQIVAENGKPNSAADKDGKAKFSDATSSDLRLNYYISRSSIVELTIKQGICVKAEEGLIAH